LNPSIDFAYTLHIIQLSYLKKELSQSLNFQTWETRKVVRDGDGNEQVTVTEHPPNEGFPSLPMLPDFRKDSPFDPIPENNQRGTSIFDKIFGGF
jgi:hypothetical protein